MAKAKSQRDPNRPVLAWMDGTTKHEILVAGPKEFIERRYNPSHGTWSDNSLIHRVTDATGFKETEMHLWDACFWGWIGRLIVDGTISREAFQLLTPSDSDRFNLQHGLIESALSTSKS